MSTLYSIGAMNQLGDALEKAGFTPEEVTKLKQFSDLGKIKDVLSGIATIAYPDHLIDTDATPFIPDGWSVEKHSGHGLWKWNPNSIQLFLSKEQERNYEVGHDLQQIIESQQGKIILNANVLDYLLAHPELIPESWKGKAVFFWGTIYRGSDGRLCVRYLGWRGAGWDWRCGWLGNNFRADSPAALAS